MNEGRCLQIAEERGGVTPYNVLPIPNNHTGDEAVIRTHPASTPLPLCRWWVRYLCPPGGVVLDPFSGLASVGVAAIEEGACYIGIEKDTGYYEAAQARLEHAQVQGRLEMFP